MTRVVMVSAAAWPSIQCLGERARPGRESVEGQVGEVEEFAVASFGCFFAVSGAIENVVLDPVDDFPLVTGVHFVEGTHGVRVPPAPPPVDQLT